MPDVQGHCLVSPLFAGREGRGRSDSKVNSWKGFSGPIKLAAMSTIWFSPYMSPIGQLLLAASERGLCALEFDFQGKRLAAAEERESEKCELGLVPTSISSHGAVNSTPTLPASSASSLSRSIFTEPSFNCAAGMPCSRFLTARRAPTAIRRVRSAIHVDFAPWAWRITTIPSPSSCPAIA